MFSCTQLKFKFTFVLLYCLKIIDTAYVTQYIPPVQKFKIGHFFLKRKQPLYHFYDREKYNLSHMDTTVNAIQNPELKEVFCIKLIQNTIYTN